MIFRMSLHGYVTIQLHLQLLVSQVFTIFSYLLAATAHPSLLLGPHLSDPLFSG